MPLLVAEPDRYPETLLSDPPATLDWYLAYTASRREKDLMRRLRAEGIAHYAPLVETRRRSPAGRVRTSWLPFFSSYVFVAATPDQQPAVYATDCVVSLSPIADADALLADLRQIDGVLSSGLPVQTVQRLEIGQTVRVKTGPLRGATGRLMSIRGDERFVIAVDFLQQGAAVAIDPCDLEPV